MSSKRKKPTVDLFSTLHIRMKAPICGCRATQEPDPNAYGIYFPTEKGQPVGLELKCKICDTILRVPWAELTANVVYVQPKKTKTSTTKVGQVDTNERVRDAERKAEEAIRRAEVQVETATRKAEAQVEIATRQAEEAMRQAEAQLGRAGLDFGTAQSESLDELLGKLFKTRAGAAEWKTTTITTSSEETQEATPEEDLEPDDPPEDLEPEKESEVEAPVDTRPAYMRHLDLEEQS